MAATANTLKKQQKTKKQRQVPVKDLFKFQLKHSQQWRQAGGLLLLGLAFFLLLAFTSFFFTGQIDQSHVIHFGWDAFRNAHPDLVANWMGTLGAWVGYVFIYSWFGVASYLFIPLLAALGLRLLLGYHLLPFLRTLYLSTFLLIWVSITMGLIVYDSLDYLGGSFGFHAQLWLRGLLGLPGAIALLVLSAVTFSVVTFKIDIQQVLLRFKKKEEEESEQPATAPSPVPEPAPTPEHEQEPEEEHEEESEPMLELKLIREDKEQEEAAQQPEQPEPKQATPTPPPPQVIPGSGDGELDLEIEHVEDEEEQTHLEAPNNEYDPTLDLSHYTYPTLELLDEHDNQKLSVNQQELEERKNLIVETLKNYNIEIDKIKAAVGPTVTLYEIVPAAGVRISRIKNLEDDIALSLAALGIRIIAPIPGKGTIGIEVPNTNPDLVSMRSVISSSKFQKTEMELPIALGKTISNEVFVTDLAKMPHLLMAGATGQGKSVGLNAIITSILYKKHPSQVKFVLVDPKKVELTLYRRIEKHFLAQLPDAEEPIITDTKKVVATLNSLCVEMDARYDLLKEAMVRNIKEYNQKFIARKLNPQKGHRYMPYIVLVIDELADLMMTAGKEIELPIARLAQLARAIGIHLILATQRPSVNIITGTIKANFPARLAFRVTSKVDSRTILDTGGAEQLIGRGDMLLSTGSDIIRLQCPFVDTHEVDRIALHIGEQQSYGMAHELPEVKEEGDSAPGEPGGPEDWDELFEDAAIVVVQNQQGSTSMIQRRLKLGYNRAGRIMDQLEAAGVVGPNEGSKAREVLMPDEYALEQLLTNLKRQ